MQFTLWQQFSSNHSAMYTVVGVFPTSAAAQDAYTKMYEIVRALLSDKVYNRELQMNAMEIKLAEQYHIDWQEGIDWLPVQPTINEVLSTYERLVFIDAPGSYTWQTGHQFAALFRAMGGDSFQCVYRGKAPDTGEDVFAGTSIRLTCQTADEAQALEIEQAAKTELNNITLFEMTSQHDSNQLILQGEMTTQIPSEFNALISWLKVRGCTNIQYQLSQTDW